MWSSALISEFHEPDSAGFRAHDRRHEHQRLFMRIGFDNSPCSMIAIFAAPIDMRIKTCSDNLLDNGRAIGIGMRGNDQISIQDDLLLKMCNR